MRDLLVVIFCSFQITGACAQVLSGYIKEKESGESIAGATVRNLSTGKFAMSNHYGFYSLEIGKEKTVIQVSSVGFRKVTKEVTLSDDLVLNFELSTQGEFLKEVVVTSKMDDQSLDKMPIGTIAISVERLKNLPVLFGEADILKSLSLTPGVSLANEGTTGLLVRGGTPDQNLILIDETPVYNVSHLFGLISVFNPDAIKNVTLYKAAFPARYGGRLSSVIDIISKEGNQNKRNVELGIGLINSRFLFEGPLLKDKKNAATFFVGARVSNLSLFLLPLYFTYLSDDQASFFNYNMFDVNAKINKQFNDKSQLFLSVYMGNDVWYVKNKERHGIRDRSALKWGNLTTSLRYIKPLTQRLFMKSTLAYTTYHYGLSAKNFEYSTTTDFLNSRSSIQDKILKTSLEYYVNSKNEIGVGVDIIAHQYRPIELKSSFDFSQIPVRGSIKGFETGSYLEGKNRIFNWLLLNPGLRYATFASDRHVYESFEPRFSAEISLPSEFSLKFGYAKMRQYIHLLTSNSVSLPNDLWVPATEAVAPQNSRQIGVGLAKNVGKGISFSLEGYHKKFSNLIEYKDGVNYLTNFTESYESTIETNGIGEAFGFEAFIDKNAGRFTGWVSYTLSWNNRKFEGINKGRWFPANFDRRHSMALTGNYKIDKNKDFSSSWVFQSGSPASVPIAAMRNPIFNGNDIIFVYGDRNNFRTPAYHRLDFSFNFRKETFRGNERTWTIGVYNAYNHKNPFYLDIKSGAVKKDPKLNQIDGWDNQLVKKSVIPFLPFINYSLKFK